MSEDSEEIPIDITFTAIGKLWDMAPDAPTYRVKVERADLGFRNLLHWDDVEADEDEVLIYENKEGKEIKVFMDPETWGFLGAGKTVIDFRNGLLMGEFTFENQNVAKIHVSGEVYKLRS